MRGLAIIIGMALALAACASETEQTTTTAAAETTTSASDDTTTTSKPVTTTTEAATTSTSDDTAGGGESCLVGDWELDSEAFMDSLSEAFAEETSTEGMTIEFVGGSYVVTLSESGLFTGDRDEWTFQMSMEEGAFRVTIDGLDTGTWSTDGSTLVIEDFESASILKAQAVVDGELVDLPQGTVPMSDSSAVTESSTYECSGDDLVVTADEEFVSEFTRTGG